MQFYSMNRLLPLTIILLYMVGLLYISAVVSGCVWGVRPGKAFLVIAFVVWSSLGLLSVLLSSLYIRLYSSVRSLHLHEEMRIRPLFNEVIGYEFGKQYRLYIDETDQLNAYAALPADVVLSKGLVDAMTDEELKGIIAHEIGHHRSKDCHYTSFFPCISMIPFLICLYAKRLLMLVPFSIRRIGCGPSLAIICGVTLSLLWVVPFQIHLLPYIITTILFIFIYPYYHKLFQFLFFWVMRREEYKQDKYAHSLGYGKALRSALIKLIPGSFIDLRKVTMIFGTHPLLYDRIRRLEYLEGMRDVDV